MHGVNLGGWLSQCSHSVEHYKSFISEEDIRKIADMGADHVRLPIDFECIETESGEPLPFGYVSISECIEWCEKYGLNVILDVHKTAGFSFDSKQNTLFDSEPLKLRCLPRGAGKNSCSAPSNIPQASCITRCHLKTARRCRLPLAACQCARQPFRRRAATG